MLGPGTDATRSINVLEFNCRMGDPETQPMMMRIKNDLTEVLELAVTGRLEQASIDWDRRIALAVVMAASNYPAAPRTGDAIKQLPADTDDCGRSEEHNSELQSPTRISYAVFFLKKKN